MHRGTLLQLLQKVHLWPKPSSCQKSKHYLLSRSQLCSQLCPISVQNEVWLGTKSASCFSGAFLNKNIKLLPLYDAQNTEYLIRMELFHWDYLDESVIGLDWNQSQSRSSMMNNTQEPWLSRWAGPLCVFTLIIVSLSSHTDAHTHLLHPVHVFCSCSGAGRTLWQHLAQDTQISHSHRLSFGWIKVNLRGSNLPQLEEGWGELVSDKTAGVGVTVFFASC